MSTLDVELDDGIGQERETMYSIKKPKMKETKKGILLSPCWLVMKLSGKVGQSEVAAAPLEKERWWEL